MKSALYSGERCLSAGSSNWSNWACRESARDLKYEQFALELSTLAVLDEIYFFGQRSVMQVSVLTTLLCIFRRWPRCFVLSGEFAYESFLLSCPPIEGRLV